MKCQPYENKIGRFILGTNETQTSLTAELMLSTYKEEQDVERGFRFIKEPCFVASYPGVPVQIMGLNENKRKIIRLFGEEVMKMYGVESQ